MTEETKLVTKRKIKCKKCNYTWWTESEKFFVPCPKCHKQIQIKSTKAVDK